MQGDPSFRLGASLERTEMVQDAILPDHLDDVPPDRPWTAFFAISCHRRSFYPCVNALLPPITPTPDIRLPFARHINSDECVVRPLDAPSAPP